MKHMFEDTEKHEFNPSIHSPHVKIIKYVPADSIVLDVGCSWGYIDKELKKKGCSITGVEIDQIAALRARQYCDEIIIGDIEKMRNLPFPKENFDVIIYSDILEHLRRPDLVLINFRTYLKRKGVVIASTPNIGRLEYRIKHLLGNFDYEPSGGILSRTHLRFFTLRTVKELFEKTGYKIVNIDYTGLASKLRILPKLLAFQFLVIATKNNHRRESSPYQYFEITEKFEEYELNRSSHRAHMKIIDLVPSQAKVLDVGCAGGHIGKELKKRGCIVTGIELNEAAAELAKIYYDKVVVGDVEQFNNSILPQRFFDVIICSDVLEHLKRPDLALDNFKRFLKPKGFVIASLPNIARVEFRILHFLGNFDYRIWGILSKAHLRFFTFKTAKELFNSTDYKVIKVEYTGLLQN